jgi:hypothetical protein
MSWAARISTNLQEVKLIFNPVTHVGTKQFIEANYQQIKQLNPRLPFMVRPHPDAKESLMICRYGESIYRNYLSNLIF